PAVEHEEVVAQAVVLEESLGLHRWPQTNGQLAGRQDPGISSSSMSRSSAGSSGSPGAFAGATGTGVRGLSGATAGPPESEDGGGTPESDDGGGTLESGDDGGTLVCRVVPPGRRPGIAGRSGLVPRPATFRSAESSVSCAAMRRLSSSRR